MYGYNYMPILYFKAYFNYEQFLARFNTWQPPNGHLIISISLYLYLYSLSNFTESSFFLKYLTYIEDFVINIKIKRKE